MPRKRRQKKPKEGKTRKKEAALEPPGSPADLMPRELIDAVKSTPLDLAHRGKTQEISDADVQAALSTVPLRRIRRRMAGRERRKARLLQEFPELLEVSYSEPQTSEEKELSDLEWEIDHLKVQIARRSRKKLGDEESESEGAVPAKASRPIARFPSPSGLKWEEVSIAFISNDSIRVKARGVSEIYTFAEIGFKDRRKGDVANSRWRLLKEGFARHNGEVSWERPLAKKDRDNLKSAVKEIRKRLRAFMGIEDDPFCPYRQVKAYKTKFSLRDETDD